MSSRPAVRRAILGGSGIYALTGLEQVECVAVTTPFGVPSDLLRIGRLDGEEVVFLARHGDSHRLLPSEINYRANMFALKALGVERVLSASAVGSMRETIHPRDAVLVDQFLDRTTQRASTFFGDGVAVHVAFADPVCPELRATMCEAASGGSVRVHDGGTYLCIEGPAFSTRAESRLYRSWDVDVVGMTNLPEAKLAREAEMCYATLCLVTDYDCWHDDAEDVSVGGVIENLRLNAEFAAGVLRSTLRALPEQRTKCSCGQALRDAILTDPAMISAQTRERLGPILGRCLDGLP